MKIFLKLIIVTLIAVREAGNPLFAASYGRTAEFLNWGAGARSLALGKAYTGVADDSTAGYWNPAGMTQLDQKETTMLRAVLWEDTNYDFAGFVYPTIGEVAWGLSAVRLASAKADGRDKDNRETGSFQNTQTAYILSYGRRIFPRLSIGTSIKKIDFDLAGHRKGNISLDLSGLYQVWEKGKLPFLNSLRLGWNIQNLSYLKTGETSDDKLNLGVRLGSAIGMLNEHLLLSLDMENQLGAGFACHFGTEYRFKYLAIRLGMDKLEASGGIGLIYKNYSVDYSYANHFALEELGGSHRVSLGLKFGLTRTEKQTRETEIYFEEAKSMIDMGLKLDLTKTEKQRKKAEMYFEEAKTLIAKGDFKRGIKKLKTCLKLWRSNNNDSIGVK